MTLGQKKTLRFGTVRLEWKTGLRLISSQWNFARGAKFPLSYELWCGSNLIKSSQNKGNSAPRAKFH